MQAEINPANYAMESENLKKLYENKTLFLMGDAYVNRIVAVTGLIYLPETLTWLSYICSMCHHSFIGVTLI